MNRSRWITAGALLAIVAAIVLSLLQEAGSGPTFRPEDHAGYAECLAAIPAEWAVGSIERSGAEDACGYVHLRRGGAPSGEARADSTAASADRLSR